jgi:general stress protein 26
MGDIQSLANQEAVEKIKELGKDQICLLCTMDGGEIISRPMGTSGIDDDGTIWFFSPKDSDKNRQIKKDHAVYVMYMNAAKNHYLTLNGVANIVLDKSKVDELWSPMMKAWFEEGKDDPNISLLKVTPTDGHYWDTKNGKLVSMLKIAAAAVTGKQMDGGIEGDLQLQGKSR